MAPLKPDTEAVYDRDGNVVGWLESQAEHRDYVRQARLRSTLLVACFLGVMAALALSLYLPYRSDQHNCARANAAIRTSDLKWRKLNPLVKVRPDMTASDRAYTLKVKAVIGQPAPKLTC